ncbi:LEA type 2 family protein [Methylibium petroleiphilum]|uniref:LEA type 2 family protein n=1 Tax=Methylibium petroleiphilum TaxID=105560 RepID=UPI003D2BD36D
MPRRRRLLLLVPALAVGACAGLSGRDPPRVSVAGLDALPGEGLELRFLVKLRVQNPNDAPIDYRGLSMELELMGQPFASGVSDAAGSVPRFGEAVIGVPASVSAIAAVRQMLSLPSRDVRSLDYRLRGKLAGAVGTALRFESTGQLDVAAFGGPAPGR